MTCAKGERSVSAYAHGELWTILLIGVAIGTDAFSLGLGMGAKGLVRKEMLALIAAVTVLHFIFPLIGTAAGDFLQARLGGIVQQGAALAMMFVGAKMAVEAIGNEWRGRGDSPRAHAAAGYWRGPSTVRSGGEDAPALRRTEGARGIWLMAFGVSVDALSVGFTLGSVDVVPWMPALTFAGLSGLLAGVGLYFGRKARHAFGEYGLMAGGAVLLVLGLKLFW